MTCPALHPITDLPCQRPNRHDGGHNPHTPDDPWSGMTPDEQALHDRFGYLPDPEAVARVDAHHAAAVRRANPDLNAAPEPDPAPGYRLTTWSLTNRCNVAHLFRGDTLRSLCGHVHWDQTAVTAHSHDPVCRACARLTPAEENAA